MKTSNKLLVGILLIILILISTTQLMVYAKYKRGEYTSFKREQFTPMTSLPIPAVRFISVKGLNACVVKPSNSLKLEIQKDNVDVIKYNVINDTLVVLGDASTTDDQMERKNRNNSLVNIYLPANVPLKGAYSTFRVWGAADAASAPSYTFNLEKNSYLFIHFRGADSDSVYFNQLTISEEKSNIDLNSHAVLNDLNLQLANSKLSDNAATISKITIATDNNSTINLSGKNVKAL